MIFLNNNFYSFSKANAGGKQKSLAIQDRIDKKQKEKDEIESNILIEANAPGEEQAKANGEVSKVIESLKNKNFNGNGNGKENEITITDYDAGENIFSVEKERA